MRITLQSTLISLTDLLTVKGVLSHAISLPPGPVFHHLRPVFRSCRPLNISWWRCRVVCSHFCTTVTIPLPLPLQGEKAITSPEDSQLNFSPIQKSIQNAYHGALISLLTRALQKKRHHSHVTLREREIITYTLTHAGLAYPH